MDDNKIWFEIGVDLLLEVSLDTLNKNAIAGFPKTTKRQHATQPVVPAGLKIIPYVGTKMLYFQFTTKSGTESGKYYKTIISFKNVVFEKEKTTDNVQFIGGDNKTYYIQPLSRTLSNAMVRCDCLDFYYRFAYQDFRDKAMYGPKAKSYVRKTTTYPPANPRNMNGICKHIMKCTEALEDAGFFGN